MSTFEILAADERQRRLDQMARDWQTDHARLAQLRTQHDSEENAFSALASEVGWTRARAATGPHPLSASGRFERGDANAPLDVQVHTLRLPGLPPRPHGR